MLKTIKKQRKKNDQLTLTLCNVEYVFVDFFTASNEIIRSLRPPWLDEGEKFIKKKRKAYETKITYLHNYTMMNKVIGSLMMLSNYFYSNIPNN